MRYIFILLVLFLLNCENNSTQKQNRPSIAQQQATVSLDTQAQILTKHSPESSIDYDTSLWTDIARLDERIQFDIRYATDNNFVDEQLYECPRCFLRPDAAAALLKVHDELIKAGYGLKLFDCYRPLTIQKRLWEKVPNASYVTPPKKGSMHNRGFAVDATLVDSLGVVLDMGTAFDFFGRKAHHDFYDLDKAILNRRKVLKEAMAKFGFKHIRTEWWHYSFKGPYTSPFKLADFQWECE